mgnify:CR=1 FL=1
MTENIYGTMEVGSTIDITDPCYDEDVWCRVNNFPMPPGTYDCYTRVMNDKETGGWGRRIGRIGLRKSDKPALRYEQKAIIGVDSGMAGFFVGDNVKFFEDVILEGSATASDVFIADGVFCSSSGYGDGGYTVYAGYDVSGELVDLYIEFI